MSGTNPRCEVYKLTERPRVCIYGGTNPQCEVTNSQRDLESVYGGTNPRCEVYKLTERPRVCIL